MRLQYLIASITLALAASLATSVSAQAVGTGNPEITSPRDQSTGQTYGYGFAPALRVSFADAPAGNYTWQVDCTSAAGYHEEGTFQYEGGETSPDVLAEDLPPVRGDDGRASTCTVGVYDESGEYSDQVVFRVDGKPMKVTDVSVNPESFYPLVRDGYRDTAKIRYTLNRSARVTVSVLTAAGATVRKDRLGWQSGSRSWTWNGRRNDGTKVRAADYRISVVATAADGPADRVDRKVVVATGWKVLHGSKSRRGTDTSSRSRTSSCYLDNFYGELHADCWGGRYARASWGFAIPATAYNISWGLPGEQGCCASPGHIKRWGTRTSRTSYRVSLEITGWRSYYAERARISYSFKRRI